MHLAVTNTEVFAVGVGMHSHTPCTSSHFSSERTKRFSRKAEIFLYLQIGKLFSSLYWKFDSYLWSLVNRL